MSVASFAGSLPSFVVLENGFGPKDSHEETEVSSEFPSFLWIPSDWSTSSATRDWPKYTVELLKRGSSVALKGALWHDIILDGR